MINPPHISEFSPGIHYCHVTSLRKQVNKQIKTMAASSRKRDIADVPAVKKTRKVLKKSDKAIILLSLSDFDLLKSVRTSLYSEKHISDDPEKCEFGKGYELLLY